MALVEKITYTLTIKERVALYTDSDLDTAGVGSQPVLAVGLHRQTTRRPITPAHTAKVPLR